MAIGYQGVPTPSDVEIYLDNWGQKPLTVEEACERLGV